MPSEPRTEAELLADFWDHIDTDLPHAAHRLASLKAHWQAEAAQGALDDVRARVEHIRGLASGDGGDEASRTDPWNALTTIVINCDELLAALQDRGADREDVKP